MLIYVQGWAFGIIKVEFFPCQNLICESSKGEVLTEVASTTASMDFEWVVPWDSTLVKEVSVGEQTMVMRTNNF